MPAEFRDNPIGIFDSGVGGLTVLASIARTVPGESLVYFGDTGRYPYGVRSNAVIAGFARQITAFLEEQRCKLIVVACNSASAAAMEDIVAMASIPAIGVIEPGAKQAVAQTRNGHVGVIGTEATINSGAYQAAIRKLNPNVAVTARACPLFVALAEEGYAGHRVTKTVAEEYLRPMVNEVQIDTLVLGCTHYPLLRDDIAAVCGDAIGLVDSADAVARSVGALLDEHDLRSNSRSAPLRHFYVSDTPDRFRRVGARFLGHELGTVHVVELESLGHKADVAV